MARNTVDLPPERLAQPIATGQMRRGRRRPRLPVRVHAITSSARAVQDVGGVPRGPFDRHIEVCQGNGGAEPLPTTDVLESDRHRWLDAGHR